jgi:2-polyprenyl-3-methyl-5-hydroxy-6-metoxy-1,4-benzoquinol methylase
VLDVGTGEGQVSRLAAAGGAELVVGIDPTWNQVTVAKQRGGGPDYLRGGPTGSRSPTPFDVVVACLVFEHIEAIDDRHRRGGTGPGTRREGSCSS